MEVLCQGVILEHSGVSELTSSLRAQLHWLENKLAQGLEKIINNGIGCELCTHDLLLSLAAR